MNKTVLWIIGGVVGLGLIVLLALSIASETPRDDSIGFGEVTVEGQALPLVENVNAGDPAIGLAAPTVSGADWNGVPHSIAADGRPKIVIFLAHWCPHCQAEVPEIQAWLDEGGLPDNVDMYSITVLNDPTRQPWPPQDWLESEGWTVPTIMDDTQRSAALAYGLAGTPFYMVLDGDNTNLLRLSGQAGIPRLEAMVLLAQASIEG